MLRSSLNKRFKADVIKSVFHSGLLYPLKIKISVFVAPYSSKEHFSDRFPRIPASETFFRIVRCASKSNLRVLEITRLYIVAINFTLTFCSNLCFIIEFHFKQDVRFFQATNQISSAYEIIRIRRF